MKKIVMILIFSLVYLFQTRAEEVSIIVNGSNIRGTLEVPKSNQPVDVVLLIAGSGPTDRDGNTRLLLGKNNSLKMLADLFSKNGIASLRYDKRGVGASDKVIENDISFDMLVNDAVEWIKFLKNDKRFSRIIIAGHSEGSLIGMIAATQIGIDKYISLCGAGHPAYSIIAEQLKNVGLSKKELDQNDKILDSLRNGLNIKNIPDNPIFKSLYRSSVQKYIIAWFKYDPAKVISELKIPILIIEGTTDIQIDVKDAEILSKSNPKSELVIVEDMNHILKEVATKDRTINISSYTNPELELSTQLCKSVIDFIKK
jgi:pimeloyl-ACP methyl ester carboxylesterase